MSIGKSSITKRVAKAAESETAVEKNIAPELVATVAAPKAEEKKAPAKKTSTSSTAKKSSTSTAKKTSSATKKETPKKETATEKKVETAVIANIAPETVAAVIGHSENSGFQKVQLGDDMPVYLL